MSKVVCFQNVETPCFQHNDHSDFLRMVSQMAIAAVAHMFVFSVDPYQYIPASEHGKVSTETTKAAIKVEEGDEEKPALLEKTETQAEASGTSITASVQDIVLEGVQHVSFTMISTLQYKLFDILSFHEFKHSSKLLSISGWLKMLS